MWQMNSPNAASSFLKCYDLIIVFLMHIKEKTVIIAGILPKWKNKLIQK